MALSYFYSDAAVSARLERRAAAAAYRRTVNPTEDLVNRLTEMQTAYPMMDHNLVVSLASAGLSASSPEVQKIADMGFELDRKNGLFDHIGDVIGGVGGMAGKALGLVGGAVDTSLGPVDEALTPGAKAAVRTGMVALETPLQELQTFIRAGGYAGVKVATDQGDFSLLNKVRNIVDPTRWDDQFEAWKESYGDAGSSSGREAISDLLRGKKVEMGSGFLPSFDEGIEQRVRDRAGRLSMTVNNVQFGGPGNMAITPGRLFAAKVSEPGETPFNIVSGLVDAGVAWFADPANAALGAVHTGRGINRLGRAGRAALHGGSVADELASLGRFAPVVDRSLQSRAAVAVGGIGDIAGRLPGKGGRNSVMPDLVESWLTKGGRQVIDKLAESNYTEITKAVGKKIPALLRRDLADASTPQEVLGVLKPHLGSTLMEAPEFRGFRVGAAMKGRVRLLNAMPGSHLDPNDMDQSVEGLDAWLRNAKAPQEIRERSLERLVRSNGRTEYVSVLSDIMGDVAADMVTRGVVRPLKEQRTVAARARKLTQMYQDDAEKVRAYAADEIFENRKAIGVINAGDGLDLQSPMLLTEYINSLVSLPDAREMRRATSTLGRLVDNPFFGRTVGITDTLQGVWKRTALMRGAYTVRVVGEEQLRMAASGLDSLFNHPLSFIAALLGDEKAAHKFVSGRRQADVLGTHFDQADELKSAMVKGWSKWDDGTIYDRAHALFRAGDEGYERAWANAVAELHVDPVAREIAKANGNLDQVKQWFYAEQGRNLRKQLIPDRPALAHQAGSDEYVERVWELVQQRTVSDPLLMDVVATGKYGGVSVGKMGDNGKWVFDEAFRRHFTGAVGPEVVKGQRILAEGGRAPIKETWDNGVGWIFSHLMTKETNYLSRSPVFRQRYWERIEEMLPHMDDATRAKALSAADGVVDAAQMKRMRGAAPVANRTITRLDDADLLAKQHGLNETKKLLYDMSERSQFFDAFRLVFPFGEAWKEVVTRWAKIGMDNPRVLRRGEQIINGGRGNGFFHKDTNGDEVFSMPFSRQISKALIGVPVEFTGRLSGLSLMSEVLPGVGPVVQVPAAALIPEEAEWNWARQFVSPFGEPDYSQGIMESFLPGWARNVRQSLGSGDPRARANAASAMKDYLLSTGDYDISDPEQFKQLIEDSISYGSKMFLLRGMAQFFSPTAPLPETLVKGDKGDELLIRREVIADLHKLTDKLGYEEGEREFVARYGVDMLATTQSMTKTITKMLPVSKQASDWVRSNKGLVKKYGSTWGFFAPQDDTEGIDFAEYGRQIDSGDRQPLTVEERAFEANKKVGRYIFALAEQRVSAKPTKNEREWLKLVRAKLREEYPGYGAFTSGVPFGDDLDKDVVPELRRAIDDPKLRKTEQAQAIRLYLAARDQAITYAQEEWGVTLAAQAAAPAREWLRRAGAVLSQRYGTFAHIWDKAFAYEVEDS